jgi:hypothetical protein
MKNLPPRGFSHMKGLFRILVMVASCQTELECQLPPSAFKLAFGFRRLYRECVRTTFHAIYRTA